ncbi:MAG TPA: DJ-1/PfpI family protein [Candidatus Binatia bacterium]|jgi:cyclohexyl-isocyanide hydratase
MIIGMLIFPDMTQLDFTGPYEVFSRLPGCEVKVIAHSLQPVAAKGGLKFIPDTPIDTAPPLELMFVPGGPGTSAIMEDRIVLEFLRRQAQQAKYVTSVCTGALALGAAGLLKGYRATTHWLSLDLLPIFGAIAVTDRVVVDRNRITGGGVTAGIDFALTIVAETSGADRAKEIQLLMEYNPVPPFACGHPATAETSIVDEVRRKTSRVQSARLEQAKRAAKLYCE